MESMKSNTFLVDSAFSFLKRFGPLLLIGLIFSTDAMAQTADAANGLCKVAGWIKTILTAAAIISVLIYIINSFFVKSSVVGDIILYVIIGCSIAAAVVYLIGLTGLSPSCSI